MTKILFLYQYAVLGGCTTQLRNRMALTGLGIEPHFVFAREHGGTKAFGDYPHVKSEITDDQLKALILQNGFEVVSVLDAPGYLRLLAEMNFKGKIVCEVHTTYPKALEYLADDNLMSAVDMFITPSQYQMNMIKERSQAALSVPVQVVPDCIDADLFRPVDIFPESPHPIVLWVGKLDDHKNWRGFLSMARGIAAERPDTEFWMVGGEAAGDDVVSKLLSEMTDKDLASSLRWIGRVEHDRMPPLYSLVARRQGCMLVTSHGESFCTAAVEAMFCGCPVVAPRHTALPEIVCHETHGLLYAPGDERDAVDQTIRLLSDKQLWASIAARDANELPGRFGTTEVLRKLRDVFEKI
ncbi:MAG: glycosyltransferase family 4 protein [Kiritimatiellia bacterium]|nr:glycosyltransferase family 4 protein [Kiritimatiellia bacterium]MDP6848370.1 glycosyltransferase family 4 protein [Kiritimatiellia bacterium]